MNINKPYFKDMSVGIQLFETDRRGSAVCISFRTGFRFYIITECDF